MLKDNKGPFSKTCHMKENQYKVLYQLTRYNLGFVKYNSSLVGEDGAPTHTTVWTFVISFLFLFPQLMQGRVHPEMFLLDVVNF